MRVSEFPCQYKYEYEKSVKKRLIDYAELLVETQTTKAAFLGR